MKKVSFENVYGIEPFTMLDFPGHLAAILFYKGCKLRCPYCYNVNLVNCIGSSKSEEAYNLLFSRKGKLDGIVFSGGECTIHGEDLINDMYFVKSLDYDIKLDTNGVNTDIVKQAIDLKLVNYVALDYKCPPEDKDNFKITEIQYNNFKNTLEHLLEINFNFEVRTTIHTDIISEEQINKIILDLDNKGYNKIYYLQNFYESCPETLGNVNPTPRKLDKNKLINPKNFKIEFRNA